MADAKKKQLVFNIIEFLRTSAQDGTVKEDDKESLEVAVQCIAESFGVDPDSSEDSSAYSIKPFTLLSLLDVFAKTKAKSAAVPSPSQTLETAPPLVSGPSDEEKAQAEALKVKGNSLMSQKQYQAAVDQYTEAIRLDPNPVFYSNRAAAWGGLGNHENAVEDAERAIDLDPKYAKGFSRLGHAQFSLGEYQKAVDAYEAGLILDPTNSNMKTSLTTARARLDELSSSVSDSRTSTAPSGMPDLSSMAEMFGGGQGGMPDLASMMRNPQMMAMAQQMMANGGMERLMADPALRRMAENVQNGGGMPDLSTLASDPSLRDLASQFMGNGGRGR